jgi:hypothetical protein
MTSKQGDDASDMQDNFYLLARLGVVSRVFADDHPRGAASWGSE